MQHLGQADVVDVACKAGEKSDVLEALNARADVTGLFCLHAEAPS